MMITRSVDHGTFTIERTYPAPPDRVFAAWASHSGKAPWFGEDEEFFTSTALYELDFRVGGRERLHGTIPNGRDFRYEATYQDIVDGERIISAYEVFVDGRRISVSLLTVEFAGSSTETRLLVTEQGAFLDGLDNNDQRRKGATDSLDRLGEYLGAST